MIQYNDFSPKDYQGDNYNQYSPKSKMDGKLRHNALSLLSRLNLEREPFEYIKQVFHFSRDKEGTPKISLNRIGHHRFIFEGKTGSWDRDHLYEKVEAIGRSQLLHGFMRRFPHYDFFHAENQTLSSPFIKVGGKIRHAPNLYRLKNNQFNLSTHNIQPLELHPYMTLTARRRYRVNKNKNSGEYSNKKSEPVLFYFPHPNVFDWTGDLNSRLTEDEKSKFAGERSLRAERDAKGGTTQPMTKVNVGDVNLHSLESMDPDRRTLFTDFNKLTDEKKVDATQNLGETLRASKIRDFKKSAIYHQLYKKEFNKFEKYLNKFGFLVNGTHEKQKPVGFSGFQILDPSLKNGDHSKYSFKYKRAFRGIGLHIKVDEDSKLPNNFFMSYETQNPKPKYIRDKNKLTYFTNVGRKHGKLGGYSNNQATINFDALKRYKRPYKKTKKRTDY